MDNDTRQKPGTALAPTDERGASSRCWFLLHPIKSLTILFLVWKAVLFLVIINCPGPGYDTSTTLLLGPSQSPAPAKELWGSFGIPSISPILRFVRWDSIYFVHIAERGYLYEQEWAFGYGYTGLLSHLTAALRPTENGIGPTEVALVAVGISHLSHFLSVLSLYALTKTIFGAETNAQRAFCLVSAALHIISPAGAFLSAPYGESLFSFLNLTGFCLYLSAVFDEDTGRRISRDVKFLAAAVLFALATTVRSNGILSGCLFAYDAALGVARVITRGFSLEVMHRLFVVVLGGSIVALGMVGPQYVAFMAYCTNSDLSRPWCKQLIPSIYGWVQAHYWNVGFLKYWTVSNLPLFCLAAPMLAVLCQSAFSALQKPLAEQIYLSSARDASSQKTRLRQSCLARLAITQGLLAIMALTSYHVQIINRISSGYPLWYWYLASLALDKTKPSQPTPAGRHLFSAATQGMVIYGLVQAVLFGSFLPPA
ncbi:hypothetical protein VTN77DRAFT_6110 [Rasamsonia byssochlamydoides]|uniref:uncharacterized protein n=1 Tax=Rasamsonia byssochlamydoides TaxID=89139 RepID=UPI003744046F